MGNLLRNSGKKSLPFDILISTNFYISGSVKYNTKEHHLSVVPFPDRVVKPNKGASIPRRNIERLYIHARSLNSDKSRAHMGSPSNVFAETFTQPGDHTHRRITPWNTYRIVYLVYIACSILYFPFLIPFHVPQIWRVQKDTKFVFFIFIVRRDICIQRYFQTV